MFSDEELLKYMATARRSKKYDQIVALIENIDITLVDNNKTRFFKDDEIRNTDGTINARLRKVDDNGIVESSRMKRTISIRNLTNSISRVVTVMDKTQAVN